MYQGGPKRFWKGCNNALAFALELSQLLAGDEREAGRGGSAWKKVGAGSGSWEEVWDARRRKEVGGRRNVG